MYQVWSVYYGEFLALGIWGMVLALARRILFGNLCREAALENGGKGRMLRAMTLKFEKSYEVKVGICDRDVFVRKYLCQEKKFGIPLERWRRLPERWTGILLCAGVLESAALYYAGFGMRFCLERVLASAAAAAAVRLVILWLETDSLWEQSRVLLLDYVSNTLYPRQTHVYEVFEQPEREAEDAEPAAAVLPENEKSAQGEDAGKRFVLEKEEEKLFQDVLSDFLGSST